MSLMCSTSTSHDWQEVMKTKHGIHRLHHWKKGTQRNTLTRPHAELAVADTRLSLAFSKDCYRCQVISVLCGPTHNL